MGGHVFAEIVKISDKDTPAHRNTATSNVLFLGGEGVGFGVGIGIAVGGEFPMSSAISEKQPRKVFRHIRYSDVKEDIIEPPRVLLEGMDESRNSSFGGDTPRAN
jgi:hypothetical protein